MLRSGCGHVGAELCTEFVCDGGYGPFEIDVSQVGVVLLVGHDGIDDMIACDLTLAPVPSQIQVLERGHASDGVTEELCVALFAFLKPGSVPVAPKMGDRG